VINLRTLSIVSAFAVVTGIAAGAAWFFDKTHGGDTLGWTIIRLEIGPEFVKDRSVYDAAVNAICSDRARGNICVIGFFLPGDKIPTDLAFPVIWKDFKPLAVWWGNDATRSKEFTHWDCSRAGVEGSPPSALCGIAAKEAIRLASSLGQRKRIGEFCNWPPRNDIATILSELLDEMAKYGRSAQLKTAYNKMLESGRNIGITERSYDCKEMRPKIDAMMDESVSNWRNALRHASDTKP
jgi:hypothetical protein